MNLPVGRTGGAGRRRVVRTVCAFLLFGAAVASGAAGAQAVPGATLRADARPYFHASLHPDTAPPGAEVLPLRFGYDGPSRTAELTVDASDMAGVAVVTGGADGCHPRTPLFTCTFHLHPDSEGWNRQELVVEPAPGARPGDSGVLRYTLDPEGMPPVTGKVTVIAGRPELRVGHGEPLAQQSVGTPFEVPVLIRNVGDVTARGVILYLDGDGDLAPAVRRAGCRYADHGTAALCTLPDVEVAPGATVRVDPSPRLAADEDAFDARVSYLAWALREAPYRALPPGKTTRGTGEPFTLTDMPDPPEHATFTDSQDPATLAVPVRNHADFEAFGASVRGAVGSEHEVTIGVRNNGPAEPDTPDVRAVFTVPPGAEVVKAPYDPELEEEMLDQACRTRDHGRHYTCRGPGRVGEKRTFAFTLRIVSDDDRPGGVSVEAHAGGRAARRRVPDPVRADDTAAVRLHVTGATGTAGTPLGVHVAWAAAATALVATGLAVLRRRRAR